MKRKRFEVLIDMHHRNKQEHMRKIGRLESLRQNVVLSIDELRKQVIQAGKTVPPVFREQHRRYCMLAQDTINLRLIDLENIDADINNEQIELRNEHRRLRAFELLQKRVYKQEQKGIVRREQLAQIEAAVQRGLREGLP